MKATVQDILRPAAFSSLFPLDTDTGPRGRELPDMKIALPDISLNMLDDTTGIVVCFTSVCVPHFKTFLVANLVNKEPESKSESEQ